MEKIVKKIVLTLTKKDKVCFELIGMDGNIVAVSVYGRIKTLSQVKALAAQLGVTCEEE